MRFSDEDKVRLTLAFVEAERLAQEKHVVVNVYWDNGAISVSADRLSQKKITEFDGTAFDIRDLDESFENLDFDSLWEEYTGYYAGDIAADYVERIAKASEVE